RAGAFRQRQRPRIDHQTRDRGLPGYEDHFDVGDRDLEFGGDAAHGCDDDGGARTHDCDFAVFVDGGDRFVGGTPLDFGARWDAFKGELNDLPGRQRAAVPAVDGHDLDQELVRYFGVGPSIEGSAVGHVEHGYGERALGRRPRTTRWDLSRARRTRHRGYEATHGTL